jgi:hypothetical protein
MARLRVIVLDQADARTFHYVLWADVPLARQPFYARPGAVSVWKDALPADNAALVSGAVVERDDTIGFPVGTNLATAQAALQTQWQSFQDEITALNRWARYGTTFDGAAWTPGGVS